MLRFSFSFLFAETYISAYTETCAFAYTSVFKKTLNSVSHSIATCYIQQIFWYVQIISVWYSNIQMFVFYHISSEMSHWRHYDISLEMWQKTDLDIAISHDVIWTSQNISGMYNVFVINISCAWRFLIIYFYPQIILSFYIFCGGFIAC